ncbi:hypothetical protein LCGC14_1111790 [marine sediment metagenome]|uniref:Uncharacterized protein n=1 Tax=marine sediment metagenome TaxID=412755 RepID=A0A0F9QCL8_9ZZZZ
MKCPYCESELMPCGEGKHAVDEPYHRHLICVNEECPERAGGKAFKCDDPTDLRNAP